MRTTSSPIRERLETAIGAVSKKWCGGKHVVDKTGVEIKDSETDNTFKEFCYKETWL